MRVAEYLLKQRGLPVYKTPSEGNKIPGWMETAFALHQKLAQMGYSEAGDDEESLHLRLEVMPEVCFRAWVDGEILPPNTLFGRLQRQMTLYNLGVNIPDPIAFFEEITRYRIVQGQVPEEMIFSAVQVQALTAAYMAWLAKNQPGQLTRIGIEGEGYITLPKVLTEK
jgi:hypothetical protein